MSLQGLKFGRPRVRTTAFVLVMSLLSAASGQGVSAPVSDGVPLTAAWRSPTEAVYRIVSPLGERTVTMMPMAARLDTLAGKTVCMVWNNAFKADVTLPVIGEALKKRYPDTTVVPYTALPVAPLPEPHGVPKRNSDAMQAALKSKRCDAVITGNGGCGICTPRANHAAVLAERSGIPAVIVTNPGFDEQARTMARDAGMPSLQVALYPDPFDLETDAQLQQKTLSLVVPRVIDALTRPLPASTGTALKPDPGEIVFVGSIDDANRYFADRGWSDGLAITPPTRQRVEEFLKYTDYAPHEPIAVLPPANLTATPWNIAVNGVMAGSRPEHMPLLIAAVQAIADPAFRYTNHGASTHGFTNFFWVNGPLARQLGIDHGQGLIAHPVNSVLGRAMSLIERNIAGLRIKETQMGSFGKVASWFLAEDEVAVNALGWEPYHVDKGFAKNANTISAGNSTLWGRNLVPSTSDPKVLMQIMAYGITNTEALASGFTGMSRRYVLIEPGVAKILAEGGYTKRGLRQDLIKTGRVTTHEATFSQVYGSFGRVNRSFEAEYARAHASGKSERGRLPPWYPRFPGWEEVETMPAVGILEFIVCGDPSRNKVQILAGGPGNAIKEIRLPASWDELMDKAGYRPLRQFALP
ncbi:MAG: hypothetical protein IH627_02220 [Rubrivivax sp.]|nr:hypothetical protein [Rubrivivax sp.]